MDGSLPALPSPVALLIGVAIFVLLLVVILATLRRADVFPPGVNVTLAICASLLAVIGIMRTFGGVGGTPEGSGTTSWLDFILLPYTAIAIAMLFVLLLLLLGRLASRTRKAPDRSKPRFLDGCPDYSRHDEDCEHSEVISEREGPRATD